MKRTSPSREWATRGGWRKAVVVGGRGDHGVRSGDLTRHLFGGDSHGGHAAQAAQSL